MRATGVFIVVWASACGSTEKAPAHSAATRSPPGAARTVSGTASNAGDVADRMSPKFRECYQIGLWQNTEQRGSVRLVVEIDATGHPAKVTPDGGDGLDKMVLNCLVGVVRRESFSPPAGGSATVTIPLNFGSDHQ